MTLKALASYVHRIRSERRPAMACVTALNRPEARDLGGTKVWFSTAMDSRRAVASLWLTDEKTLPAPDDFCRCMMLFSTSETSLAKDALFLAELMEFRLCMPGRLLTGPVKLPRSPPLPSDPAVGRRRGPTCIAAGRNDAFSSFFDAARPAGRNPPLMLSGWNDGPPPES